MARVPGAAPVKSRRHATLTAPRATELYRCFFLDRLDALAAVPVITRVVAFTPAEARDRMAARVPPAAMDSDSPTLPMAYVAEAAAFLRTSPR